MQSHLEVLVVQLLDHLRRIGKTFVLLNVNSPLSVFHPDGRTGYRGISACRTAASSRECLRLLHDLVAAGERPVRLLVAQDQSGGIAGNPVSFAYSLMMATGSRAFTMKMSSGSAAPCGAR